MTREQRGLIWAEFLRVIFELLAKKACPCWGFAAVAELSYG
ncbi:hypothetical protein Rrhod_2374 [Rhodococcus rhodnii LMG 5362]|uniref:Uncharacterized protein n=1 Tax=Rhodococcus rhodnii LMG 5362 TaxID=1273125 RepID=R7WQM6_9NOCA|nr:hypothetical protein Rrhod_2374 [Rhodococcus rhodnii LMG 5362]